MAKTVTVFQVFARHSNDEDAGFYYWIGGADEPEGPYPTKGSAQRAADRGQRLAA